ncbi:DUF262 domain-containing protein [Flavobacterium hauense]
MLLLKTINELRDYSFFIPSYQRGYRWASTEIRDLLNDICEFKPKEVENSDDKTWYCLQPIVVKYDGQKSYYEVIDGQQRLTTIYLILFHLNQYLAEDYREPLFSLNYETRTDSNKFLNELELSTGYDNIDFHYISEAYKTIKDWFKLKSSDRSFNRNDFESKFKFSTKVIWYESSEDDAISIFTRINIGKIPLTNSELIKALFLNSSNFEDRNREKLKLRQLEIATEWDLIEQSLQRNKFWFFLTGDKKSTNRIELIFDMMNDSLDPTDKYSTFRYFSKKFTLNTKDTIDKNWQEIKNRYQRFSEWFDDRELYHKIGFLITEKHITIKELYHLSSEKTKKEFKNSLDELIKESVKNINFEVLQYDDKEDVKRILLLYNLLTILKSDRESAYFPFDLFKIENWDIEHITSIKNEMPDKKDEWLKDAIIFIDPDIDKKGVLKKRASEFVDFKDNEKFKLLYEDIINHFNHNFKEDDINDISNLTLLDASTNRGYKNAVFPLKRKTIINRDKQGIFVPICTKNVFLKYFSEYPPKISFWTPEDKEHYEKDLLSVLEQYLN